MLKISDNVEIQNQNLICKNQLNFFSENKEQQKLGFEKKIIIMQCFQKK